jgi:hypothetical protein
MNQRIVNANNVPINIQTGPLNRLVTESSPEVTTELIAHVMINIIKK